MDMASELFTFTFTHATLGHQADLARETCLYFLPQRSWYMQLEHVCSRFSESSLVQGNCSDPDAASALGLSAESQVALLPLKPRQCIILVPDSMLMFNPGKFYMENLYLKAQLTAVSGGLFAFLSGADIVFQVLPAGNVHDLFLANVNFHGMHRRVAAGVVLHHSDSRVLIQGAEYCWHSCSAATRCVWCVLRAGKVP